MKNINGCRQKLNFKCLLHNNVFESEIFLVKMNTCVQCPLCKINKGFSQKEKQLYDYIKTIYNDLIEENVRSIVAPYELDIYLPKLKKAIEFNGTHWHSFPNTIRKDKIKQDKCLQLGISLLVVLEENWDTNKEKILQQIKDFIFC